MRNVTLALLKKKGACQEGITWFTQHFPHGETIEDVLNATLEDKVDPLAWIYFFWGVIHLFGEHKDENGKEMCANEDLRQKAFAYMKVPLSHPNVGVVPYLGKYCALAGQGKKVIEFLKTLGWFDEIKDATDKPHK